MVLADTSSLVKCGQGQVVYFADEKPILIEFVETNTGIFSKNSDKFKGQKQPFRGVLLKNSFATLLKSHFGMGVLL